MSDCTWVSEIRATPKKIATYDIRLRKTPLTAGVGRILPDEYGGVYVWVPGVTTGVYVVAEGRGGADWDDPPVGISASSGVESIYTESWNFAKGSDASVILKR
jgi:hypothetical protein